MKLSLFVIIVLVVAALILLYLVARRFKPFGHATAFVCAVAGSVLVTLSYHMERAANYCKRALDTTLKSINDTGVWSMGDLLRRLISFCIGFLILAGETVQVMEVLPSLFQAATVNLPPIFELSSAALFICCSALFGDIVLECWGKVRGVGLFQNMGKPSRWIVGSLSMLLLLFSDLVNGYFYIFRAEILAHHATSGMTVYILGGLGLEVSAVAPFALLAVKEGSSAALATLLWLLEKTFQAVHVLASLPVDQLDTIAFHLTEGESGIRVKLIERDPHKFPALFGSAYNVSAQPGALQLPQHLESTSIIDADTNDDTQVFPLLTPDMEEKLRNNPDCNASIIFVGSFGSRLRPHFVGKIPELRATESIYTSAYLDMGVNHIPTAIPGIVDISPSQDERKTATLHGKNLDQIYALLIDHIGDTLIELHRPIRHVPGVVIYVVDPYQLVDFANAAEAIKRRYPLISILVVTSLSDQDLSNPTVLTGVGDLQSLHAEDILETCIVTSPRSAFAASYGEQTQLKFTAQALVSLLLSHRHNLNNRSMISVLEELHTLSPFASPSFASEAVALGDVARRFKWIPGVGGAAGSHIGDFSDIVLQGRAVATRVLTDPETRAFEASVSNDSSCFLVFNTPLQLTDPRFPEFSLDLAHWSIANYPFASTVTVRANGIAMPYSLGGKFQVSAHCLYPLQPAYYPRLQQQRSVKVTPLFNNLTALEPVQGNGRVTDRLPNEIAKKKPAPSRKSRRVVVRKNNKQAK